MEQLLFKDDDSSSGESANAGVQQVNPPPKSATTAATPAPNNSVNTRGISGGSGLPPPPTAAPPSGSTMSHSERLRSLYSHKQPQAAPAAPTASPKPATAPVAPPPHQRPPMPGPAPAAPMPASYPPYRNPQPQPQQAPPPHHSQMSRPAHGRSLPAPPVSAPLGRGRSTDPYEPTPVTKITERHQQAKVVSSSSSVSSSGVRTSSSSGGAGVPSSSSSTQHGVKPSHIHHHNQRHAVHPHHQHHGRAQSSTSTSSISTVPTPNTAGGVAMNTSTGGMGAPRGTSVGSTSTSRGAVPTPLVSSSRVSGSAAAGVSVDRARELKKQKEHFLVFTRVLMKYLEQKDPVVHKKVKAIIKDCAERNKRQERGYESVTASMRSRLRDVVSEAHWNRAEAYLKHIMQQRQPGSSGSSSAASGGVPSMQQSSGTSSRAPVTASQHPGQTPSTSSTTSSAIGMSSMTEQQRLDLERRKAAKQQQQAAVTAAAAAGLPGAASRSISNIRKDTSARISALQQAGGAQPPVSTSAPAVVKSTAAATPTPSHTTSTAATGTKYSSTTAPTSAALTPVPTATPSSTAPTTTTSTTPTSSSQSLQGSKGQSAQAVKRSVSKASSATSPTATATSARSKPPVVESEVLPPALLKEYNEFMDQVDHALNFSDWTAAGLLLGSQTETLLSEEQKRLLYDRPSPPVNVPVHSFPRYGWSKRNLVSTRTAWAKMRLPERQHAKGGHPIVGGGLLTLPPRPGTPHATSMPVTGWFNEEVAEADKALALVSEACQVYVRSVLEKAIECARQRQNLDGIRLWHKQVTDNTGKLPLSLRLGCDVRRQVSQAQGNAALTVKRMEEALERQEGIPVHDRMVDQETLKQAQSMSDVALRPRLKNAIDKADYEAKRNFEYYGGKEANDPPLGRVPKKAKLSVVDFQMGMHLAVKTGQHRATTVGGAFSF